MTELANSFTLRLPAALHADLSRLSRVLGVSYVEIARRAIEEAVDRASADPDIEAALAAMLRLESRSDAPPLHETPGGGDGEPATGAGAAERPIPRASRSAGTRKAETRAPEAEAATEPVASAPAQSDDLLDKEQRDAIGRRVYGALKHAKLTTAQAAQELDISRDSFEAVLAGNVLFNGELCIRALEWAESKFKEGVAA